MKISVIIPVYSEEEALKHVVKDVTGRIRAQICEIILIVSPRSTEKTFEICEELKRSEPLLRVMIQRQNPGYGLAYREAFAAALGDYVLMLDADGEFDLSSLPQMVRAAEDGADLVQGARWVRGGGAEGLPLHIYVANRLFQYFLRLLFRAPLHDFTYGYKLIATKVIRAISWEGTRHELAMETLLKPLRYGYRVTEVPTFYRSRKEGKSKNQGLRWRLSRYLPLALRIYFSSPPPGTPAHKSLRF